MIFYFLYEIYQKGKEGQQSKSELQRIRGNRTIFSLLLHQQREISDDVTGLGITIGSPTAKNKLLKICNPYCNPCAKSHRDIEKLLSIYADIQVQIIFTVSSAPNDKRAMPVRHLLAIAEKKDQEVLKQALNDWYNAPQKNYDVFSAKYPYYKDLQLQDSKIEAMNRWTEEKEIHFTPTIFLNGHQLPDIYSIDNIKYFLSE
jgi:protein-disulfide isomerase